MERQSSRAIRIQFTSNSGQRNRFCWRRRLRGTDSRDSSTDRTEHSAEAVRVLVVDDLLATGGTVGATVGLIRQLGGTIVAAAFLIELDALNGRANLDGYPIISLMHL